MEKLKEYVKSILIAIILSVQAHSDAPRFLKRVIAVEGDHVEVKDGVVYRNGEPLIEPYIKDMPDYTLLISFLMCRKATRYFLKPSFPAEKLQTNL